MKVRTNTPDLFVAGYRTLGCAIPAFMFALLVVWMLLLALSQSSSLGAMLIACAFFAPFLALSLWGGFSSIGRKQLLLNRQTGEGEVRHRTSKGYERTPFDLSDVTGARSVEPRPSTTGSPPPSHFHVVLEIGTGMDPGTHQLTDLPLDRKEANALAETINSWLAAP